MGSVIPGGQPRVTPYPSCSLAGYDNIPPNVKVHSAAGVIHRNPEVFPEPYKWEPNRWLHASDSQIKEMNHWFWAFGSGGEHRLRRSLIEVDGIFLGRMCIGSNFATQEMKLVIAAVVSCFEVVELGDQRVDEAMRQEDAYTAQPVGGELRVRLKAIRH